MIFSLILNPLFYILSWFYSVKVTNEEKWDYFVFAQNWPPAACLDVPHGRCAIPKVVSEWSIHGLWPTSNKGSPGFCNHSWPFDPSLLKPLLPELEKKWPNIYANTSEFSFWKHEWDKHGTCAASLKSFNNEAKYFRHSLNLHDKYNLYMFLKEANIYPNAQPYLLSIMEDAIVKALNATVRISCKNHKQYKFPIFTSVEICVDKELNILNCNKECTSTCNSSSVLYLPFNRTETNYI